MIIFVPYVKNIPKNSIYYTKEKALCVITKSFVSYFKYSLYLISLMMYPIRRTGTPMQIIGIKKINKRRTVMIIIGNPFLLSLTVSGFAGGGGTGPCSSPS